jgi:hypothetical protein
MKIIQVRAVIVHNMKDVTVISRMPFYIMNFEAIDKKTITTTFYPN